MLSPAARGHGTTFEMKSPRICLTPLGSPGRRAGSRQVISELSHQLEVGLSHRGEEVAVVSFFSADRKSPLVFAAWSDVLLAVIGIVEHAHQAPVGFLAPAVDPRPEFRADDVLVSIRRCSVDVPPEGDL